MIAIFANSDKEFQSICKSCHITNEDILLLTREYTFFLENKDKSKVLLIDGKFPILYKETLEILSQYNNRLKHLSIKRPWVYEMHLHIEGGSAQAIADTIYYAKMYSEELKPYIEQLSMVFVGVNYRYFLDYQILDLIGEQYNIKIKPIYSTLSDSIKCGRGKSINKLFQLNRRRKIHNHFNKLVAKNWINGKRVKCEKYECGMFFMSSAIKHFNWRVGLFEEISKIAHANVICMNNAFLDKFSERGIECVNISETRLTLKTIVKAQHEHFHNVSVINKMLGDFELFNYGLDISEIVKNNLYQYVLCECADHMIFDILAEGLLKRKQYKLVQSWMPFDCYMTSFYMHSRDVNTHFFRKDMLPDFSDEAYPSVIIPNESELDFAIIAGPESTESKKVREEVGYAKKYYFFEKYRIGYDKKFPPKIEVKEKIKILWAPTYPLEGYDSFLEHEYRNQRVLSYLSDREDVELYIKYHPNESEEWIQKVKNEFGKRAVFIEKTVNIFSVIEKVDLVITTLSTVIPDCIGHLKPVVCLDRGVFLKLSTYYKTAVPTFVDCEEMLAYIEQIVNKPVLLQDILNSEFYMFQKLQAKEGFDVDAEIARIVRCELDQEGY